MPFINVKTSAKLNEEKVEAIKSEMGKAITLFPGKTEAWLMVNVETDCKLYFKGNKNENTAFVDVAILGSATKEACENVTQKICDIMSDIAAVPPSRTYVKFEFSDLWGYNGYMF